MTAELAMLATDPDALEAAADPGAFVVLACERAKEWLRQAVEHGEIDQIVEVKSQAEAIRVYTAQKQIGKDAELSAAEVVRRAERGIGLAIRKGQETGEFLKPHEANRPNGVLRDVGTKKSTTELFGTGGTKERTSIYAMTDGVSDEQFDAAVDEAKEEQNLSRANVVRKVRAKREAREVRDRAFDVPGDESKRPATSRWQEIADLAAQGHTSAQIGKRIGVGEIQIRRIARDHNIQIPADTAIGKVRKTDSNRIVRETAHALEGLAMGIQLVDFDELDQAQIADWANSLNQSMRALSKFAKKIKEMTQ